MRYIIVLALSLALLGHAATAEVRPVTRGEFILALWESAGAVPYDASDSFCDVALNDTWATAVGWAKHEQLILGTGENAFEPERVLTREEAATILRRWAERLGQDTFLPDGVAECNDNTDISPWADDSLYWACDTGVLEWSPGGRLDPYGSLSWTELEGALPPISYD